MIIIEMDHLGFCVFLDAHAALPRDSPRLLRTLTWPNGRDRGLFGL